MKLSVIIAIVSLLLAIVFTIAAERKSFRPLSRDRFAWAALVALYGVCVGILSAVAVYFFGLSELAALAISVPLGVPALFVATKLT